MDCFDEVTRFVSILTSLREPYNHHGSLVAGLAVNLARAYGLPAEQVELIRVGADLHDVGKLLVAEKLLNVERKLTDEERKEVEKHVMLGWAVVHEAKYDETICGIVRSHHEHLNGSGYPDGLSGDAIPMAVRIVTVCDCYEALTHKRPYRDAYSHQFAMAMIQKDKRKIFDPQLVDLFFTKVARG